MFKKLSSLFGAWFSIADIFGYVIVFMISCCVWSAYQNTKNLATNARIIAKVKLNDYSKIQTTEKNKQNLSNPEVSDSKSLDSADSQIKSYYEKAKETLNSLNYAGAKNKVKDLNNSLTEIVSEVQTEFLDPREISPAKNNANNNPKKAEPVIRENKDSLSPL